MYNKSRKQTDNKGEINKTMDTDIRIENLEVLKEDTERANFFIEQNKKSLVFDNLRYFWKINEKGERLERAL